MTMSVYTPANQDAWNQVLEECAPYDFYHLPRYHQMAEEAGEGSAKLFVFREGNHTIALPLLIRALDATTDWNDATSAYGYVGPIASPGPIPQHVVANFQENLVRRLSELRVVSIFARLNTFLVQEPLLAGLGACRTYRQTVSIDLTQPLADQRARYRQSVKTAVNRIRRAGVTCVHDRDGTYLADFVDIYHETMRRVNARNQYYFSLDYFKQTLQGIGADVNLFVGLHQDQPVCGALFVATCGILQYHLGGTRDASIAMAPMKVLIDDVRVWATDNGCKVLHLGGGLTSAPDDSLFYFKTGFSDQMRDFTVWHWILEPNVYRRLCMGKAHRNRRRGLRPVDADFFPAYRCPAVPRQPTTASDKAMDRVLTNGGAS